MSVLPLRMVNATAFQLVRLRRPSLNPAAAILDYGLQYGWKNDTRLLSRGQSRSFISSTR